MLQTYVWNVTNRQSRHIEATMRQLKIDLSELEMAFDSGSEMISHYDVNYLAFTQVRDGSPSLLEAIMEPLR
jgi:hypothetical protein